MAEKCSHCGAACTYTELASGTWRSDFFAFACGSWVYSDHSRVYQSPSCRIAELQAKNARLLEALRKYGRHETSCDLLCTVSKLHPGACDCGWEAVLAVMEKKEKSNVE